MHEGQVKAVRGAVLDVHFVRPPLPAPGEALHVLHDDGTVLLAEVTSQLSTTDVRAIALQSTGGLARGLRVQAQGQPLQVPVGPAVLGRLLDVTGQLGDDGPPLPADVPRSPIHRAPPPLASQSGSSTLFATGLKVIDLLTPLVQGGKAAMFGGAGVGKTVLVMALCAEQGFAGSFNERVLDTALPLASGPANRLFIVGDRGLMVAANRDRTPDWNAPMATHPDDVPALADRLSDAIDAALDARAPERVLLVQDSPGEGDERTIVQRRLLPFDFDRFPCPNITGQVPLFNLPPAMLLAQPAVEYVHADLCEALMLSYAAENQARVQAMIAARGNLEHTEASPTQTFQRVRQEDITEEILELSSGARH